MKPENILLDKVSGMLKLADLGLAIRIGTQIDTEIGTPGWQSPELASQNFIVDASSDVYCAAIVVLFLFTGTRMATTHAATWITMTQSVGVDVANLIRACVHVNPAQRPAIPELLQQVQQLRTNTLPFLATIQAVVPGHVDHAGHYPYGTHLWLPVLTDVRRSRTHSHCRFPRI